MPKPDAGEGSVRVKTPKTGTEKKAKKKISVPKTISGEHMRHAASVSAKAGKKAAEGLGGVILLAAMLAGEGAKKLCACARQLMDGAKSAHEKRAAGQAAPVREDYELELIRPEDYHGRSRSHVSKEKTQQSMPARAKATAKDKRKELLINRLLSAALLCVALYSAWQIGAIVYRSIRTNRLNDELSQQRAAIIQEQQLTQEQEESAPDVKTEDPALPALAQATVEETVQADEQPVLPTPTSVPEEQQVLPTPTRAPDVVKTTKYRIVGGDALPEMAELYKKNRDLVAWIQIPDVLDLPVVYRDNSYYLTRDFNKQKNAAGTIFLDKNHPFKEKTQNLLLHGHNMKDGTMFGRLAQYLHDDTYIRNHPFIYFDTLWHKEQYVIFAMLNVSLEPGNERFFNYFTHDTFSSDREFETYIRQLQLRSYYAIPIDVNASDALLTLSTCLDDDRLVIVARRLRPNETRSELRTLIRMTTKQ